MDEVDYATAFDNLYSEMDDSDKFFRTRKLSYNMLRYIISLAKVGYQGQLHSTEMKRKYADDTKKIIEFNVQLTKGHYTIFQNVHLCLPLKFKLAVDNNNSITAGLMRVNNVFVRWIKEIDIKRYDDDMPILPLTNMVNIYQYLQNCKIN